MRYNVRSLPLQNCIGTQEAVLEVAADAMSWRIAFTESKTDAKIHNKSPAENVGRNSMTS